MCSRKDFIGMGGGYSSRILFSHSFKEKALLDCGLMLNLKMEVVLIAIRLEICV